jgi:class 3 adenylate cyclase/tetratricopeptide (TPR) repeat protein
MRCPECAAPNREGVRFCEHCGVALAGTCPRCGAAVPAGRRFCGHCGSALGPAARSAATPPESGRRELVPGDERRWVTVLFADLSGFTSLAERMDPEDVKALAHRCVERLAVEVHRFGGTVIDVLGDGVMAVFGAPVGHEDDAERAVRAGLAIRDCALSDPTGRQLPVHVGINTGEVMAGQIGPEQRRQYAVMGDTTNTAARLMSAAEAGSVLVGEETYRATCRSVRYRDVTPVEAKGKESPVRAWEALEVASAPRRRELGTAPLVGRDAELSLLSGIWSKVVREARPHLVTILGEPGIGKSRLVAEFERRVLGDSAVLHGRCLPYGEVLGYWALATAVKEAAGITAQDEVDRARAKLSDLVGGVLRAGDAEAGADDVACHLALLTGLDTDEDRSAAPPDQGRLHASVRRFLEALARRRPLCLVVEDIHWADDGLLDLVEFVASRAHEAPLLLVTQARPELLERRSTWGRGVRAFTSLSLEALDDRSGRELVLALCAERRLTEDVADRVSRMAGGNPLFAEELVATISERSGAAGIPATIKALISARLDGLPPEERGALQQAAVFGKAFWVGGLRTLGTPGEVTDRLERLERKDLLRSERSSRFHGEREYAFKHDLIREVAYETLPRSERRELHGRVADWIQQVAGERVEEYFDLLAYHALQADHLERALDYLVRAAERARRAAARRQEAALLAQAIAIAERTGRAELLPDLRSRRGKALARVGVWAAARPELEAALQGLGPGPAARRAEVLVDLSEVCFWALDVPGLRGHATEALGLAEAVARSHLVLEARGWLAMADNAEGELASSVSGCREAIAQARELRIAPPAFVLPVYCNLLYFLGQHAEAVERGREAVQVAREASDTANMMLALPHYGHALAACGRYDEAQRVFDEARRFGREYGVGPLLARAIAVSAGYHLDVFDFAGNEAIADEARELARSVNFPPTLVSAGIELLLDFIRRQEVGRAEGVVVEVEGAVEKAAGWHGWIWKIRLAEARAELALARADFEEALRRAGDAIELNRGRKVKYHAAAVSTRAKALHALGRTREAISDLRRLLEFVRSLDDPAMFLRAAPALLAIEGDDDVAAEARAAADRIAGALPDQTLRHRFASAEPVRLVRKLAG